ncbi:hypothetical protein EDC04DRAFT_2913552 [Pisolithus marmoratus]|nr:hypothetical protein EDC04DRAFT_2913552 [Pisolithus marmoratus]
MTTSNGGVCHLTLVDQQGVLSTFSFQALVWADWPRMSPNSALHVKEMTSLIICYSLPTSSSIGPNRSTHTIYPYIHSFSNVLPRETLLKAVTIPDVLPSDLPPGSNFSLVAGDFEEIYGVENIDENEPQAGK